MSMTLDQLTTEALALTGKERGILMDRLVESLEHQLDPEIEKLWLVEARRRLEELQSGKVQAIPADDVFRELLSS
ncbi:MAG: putative addiction module component [Verrucomicrobia bacterium]|jgi:putative addiction module component (TIGR02574 family)|nr:putative addiction module component [Verrucomicrobiota bacterium]